MVKQIVVNWTHNFSDKLGKNDFTSITHDKLYNYGLRAVQETNEELNEMFKSMNNIVVAEHWYGDDEVQMHKELMDKVNALPDDPMYDDIRAKYQKKAHELYNPQTKQKSWDV